MLLYLYTLRKYICVEINSSWSWSDKVQIEQYSSYNLGVGNVVSTTQPNLNLLGSENTMADDQGSILFLALFVCWRV